MASLIGLIGILSRIELFFFQNCVVNLELSILEAFDYVVF